MATVDEEKGFVGRVPVLVPGAAFAPAEHCAKPSGQALGRHRLSTEIFNRKHHLGFVYNCEFTHTAFPTAVPGSIRPFAPELIALRCVA